MYHLSGAELRRGLGLNAVNGSSHHQSDRRPKIQLGQEKTSQMIGAPNLRGSSLRLEEDDRDNAIIGTQPESACWMKEVLAGRFNVSADFSREFLTLR